jgi:hypothetical protein
VKNSEENESDEGSDVHQERGIDKVEANDADQ